MSHARKARLYVDLIVGLVSPKGIFIGSSTENSEGINDLVIAAPVGSNEATNATLNGSYKIAYMDPTYFPSTATSRSRRPNSHMPPW